jgi:hypothetical protein
MEDAGSKDEFAEPAVATDKGNVNPLSPTPTQSLGNAPHGDTSTKPVTMTRGASHSADVVLMDGTATDGMDLRTDASVDGLGTILWRHVAFRVVHSPIPGRPNELVALISLPGTKGEDRWPQM